MKRREFLAHVLLATTAAWLTGCVKSPVLQLTWTELAGVLTGLDAESVIAIGSAVADTRPATQWHARLPEVSDLIWTAHGARSEYTRTRLIRQLRAVCADQYTHGSYQLVEGWILSELEVALCALSVDHTHAA